MTYLAILISIFAFWLCHYGTPIPAYSTEDPVLSAFTLDCNEISITFEFDRQVDARTMNISAFQLQGVRNLRLNSSDALFSQNVLRVNSYYSALTNLERQGNQTFTVQIYFDVDVYAQLVQMPTTGKSARNSFVALDRGFIYSSNGFPSRPIYQQAAFRATRYINDTSPPFILKFGVNMNRAQITFIFSEPINLYSIGLYGMAAQSRANALSSGQYAAFIAANSSSPLVRSSDYNRNVTIGIGRETFNLITSFSGLWTAVESTFFSAYYPFVRDVAGNFISTNYIDRVQGLQASFYVLDVTPPTLYYWDLNIDAGYLTIVFSKTIRVSYFNISRVVILSSADSTSMNTSFLVLSNPKSISKTISASVTVTLSDAQISFIKLSNGIGRSANSSFIAIQYGAVIDTSDNQNKYQGLDATLTAARKVRYLQVDITRPQLAAVAMDLTAQTISFTFSEAIMISSLQTSQVSFQSRAVLGPTTEALVPAGLTSNRAILLTKSNSNIVRFQMTAALFNVLKSSNFLGRSLTTTFVAITKSFVTDLALVPNLVLPISTGLAMQITSYVPDRISPSLISWYFDMDRGQINLVFSEPMDIASLVPTEISLFSSNFLSPSIKQITLSSGSYVQSLQGTSTTVIIQLSPSDLNYIKLSNPLCINRGLCYISFSASFGTDVGTYDTSGVLVTNPVNPVQFAQCSIRYIPDTTPPFLLEAVYNAGQGQLMLLFNEPVVFSAGDMIAFTDGQSSAVVLSAFSKSDGSRTTNITVNLCVRDIIALKIASPIASSSDTTFINARVGTVSDVFNNKMGAINYFKCGFIVDAVAPSLLAFFYNSSTSIASLYFNDLMSVTSPDLSMIYLVSASGTSVSLARGQVDSTSNSDLVQLDLFSLRDTISGAGIGSLQSSTFIYFSSVGSFFDLPRGNPTLKIIPANAVRAGNNVLSFWLDLELGALVLEMATNIQISTVRAGSFNLKSSLSLAVVKFSTFNSSSLLSPYFVELPISRVDISNIQSNLQFTSRHQLTLTITPNGLIDSNGLQLTKTVTVPCSFLRADVVTPVLLFFDLDLGTGLLILHFSHPVLVSSLQLSSLYLTSSRLPNSASLVLTDSLIVSSDVATSIVTLSLNAGPYPNDREKIMIYSTMIGSSESNTYLYATDGFATNTALPPQYLPAITQNNATKVRKLTPDYVPPKMVLFNVDLTARTVVLLFDEAINPTSNKPRNYLLLRDPNLPFAEKQFLLTSNTSLSQSGGRMLIMNISQADFDAIMYQSPNLCTSSSNCYISIRAGAVQDIAYNRNNMLDVFFRFGVKVSTFTPNSLPAVLARYDLSMQTGEMDLYFSDVIQCSRLMLLNFMFQNLVFVGGRGFTFSLDNSTSFTCKARNVRYIHLDFGLQNMIAMKAIPSLLKSKATTFLVLQSGAFYDVSGNPNAVVNDGSALQVNSYQADTVAPILLSFSVSAQAVVTLYFNEPVNQNTLTVSEISFQDNIPAFVKSYALSAAVLTSVDTYRMQLAITLGQDLFRIKTDSSIFLLQTTTYLRCTQFTISDTTGNALVPIDSAHAMIMGPSLKYWDIDLDSKKLYLYFSEAVNSTFSPNGIIIQSSANILLGGISYLLVTMQRVAEGDSLGAIYVAKLGDIDINTLKYEQLANSSSNSFLSMPFGQTKSKSSGTIVPYLKSIAISQFNARQVRFFYPDKSNPKCLYFDLNLNSGILLIEFDEPVVAGTLVLASVTLLSKEAGNFVSLVPGLPVATANLTGLEISINSQIMLDLIKLSNQEGPLDGMILQPNSVKDFNGNAFPGNFEFSAILRRNFVADATRPRIAFSSLDLGQGVLQIVFDEVMNIGSCHPFNIYILSNSTIDTAAFIVQLSNYSLVTSTDPTRIMVNLALFELDYFKLLAVPQLGRSSNSTFVEIIDASDLARNKILSVAVEVSVLVGDSVRPTLRSFQVMRFANSIEIRLYFSEIILLSTFNCSEYLFSTRSTRADYESVRFDYSECFDVVGRNNAIVFFVNSSVVDGFSYLFVNNSETRLSTINSLTTDAAGNLLHPIVINDAIQLGTVLTKYFVNLMKGTITLVFSSEIRLETFDISQVGFYSSVSGDATFLSSNSTVRGIFGSEVENTTFVEIYLGPNDLINVKVIDPIQKSFYIMLKKAVAIDIFGNFILSLGKEMKFTALSFVVDTQRPQINHVTLDMSSDFIQIIFDEPIRSNSVVLSNIRIQSNRSSLSTSVKLTGGTVIVNKNVLKIQLAKSDMVAIKLTPALAKSVESSFISCTFNTLADYFGITLRAIPFSSALQVDSFVPDTKSPDLVSFNIDFATNVLTLIFSEPVISSLNMTTVTIQNAFYSGNGKTFRLTGGEILNANSDLIRIRLLLNDVNNMKLINNLGTTRQYTFLVVSSALTTDVIGNSINPIVDGNALPVSIFVRDNLPPRVIAFSYNADKFYILFNMSEPVLMSSVQATGITISSSKHSQLNYTLSRFSHPHSQTISFELILDLSPVDSDSIKNLTPLASSREKTWISFDSTLVQDVFLNPVIPQSAENASLPEKYIADVTPPVIVTYNLDMNKMTITLIVSEALSLDELNLEELIIQNCPVRRFCQSSAMIAAFADLTISVSQTVLTIRIPHSTEFFLKFNRIATSQQTSFLSWSDKFAFDTAGNAMLPFWDSSVVGFEPRLPDNFQADTTKPELLNWFYDRKKNNIHLRFSEPVVQIDAGKIILRAHLPTPLQSNKTSFVFGNSSFVLRYQNLNIEAVYSFSNPCSPFDSSCLIDSGAEFLSKFEAVPLALEVRSGAFQDLAANANLIQGNSEQNEGHTVCGKCSEGYFAVTNCTSSTDEVCSKCSVCPVGMFMFAPCTQYRDTLCAECSNCRVGDYIASACTGIADTVCAPCTTCNNLQYASQDCANGLNRICTTCQSCFFRDPVVRGLCDNDRYRWWAQANCCFDDDGNQIKCNMVDRQNMYLLTRNGRHHWAYSETTPDVSGSQYALGKVWPQ